MIIERVEFRLKFGKAKEAVAIWREILEVGKQKKDFPRLRMLTDLSGPSYTLVLELQMGGFMDIGPKYWQWMTDSHLAELYQKFVPLCDSSHKEYYRIEYEI